MMIVQPNPTLSVYDLKLLRSTADNVAAFPETATIEEVCEVATTLRASIDAALAVQQSAVEQPATYPWTLRMVWTPTGDATASPAEREEHFTSTWAALIWALLALPGIDASNFFIRVFPRGADDIGERTVTGRKIHVAEQIGLWLAEMVCP